MTRTTMRLSIPTLAAAVIAAAGLAAPASADCGKDHGAKQGTHHHATNHQTLTRATSAADARWFSGDRALRADGHFDYGVDRTYLAPMARTSLYRSPDTRTRTVATIDPTMDLVMLDENQNWTLVRTSDGDVGWIPRRDIRILDAPRTRVVTWAGPIGSLVTVPTNLDVVNSPYDNAFVVSRLGAGDRVRVIDESNGWLQVRTNTGLGWVPSRDLNVTTGMNADARSWNRFAGINAEVLTNRPTTLVLDPHGSAEITGRIGAHVPLTVLDQRGDWVRVRTQRGDIGWIRSDRVERTDHGTWEWTREHPTNRLDRFDRTRGGFERARGGFQGTHGRFAMEQDVAILASDAVLYTTPSHDAPARSWLVADDSLVVLRNQGDWTHVRTATGEVGWVPAADLTMLASDWSDAGSLDQFSTDARGQTILRMDSGANIFARPDKSSRVVADLDSGDRAVVLRETDGWLRVRANGRTGWVPKSAIETYNMR